MKTTITGKIEIDIYGLLTIDDKSLTQILQDELNFKNGDTIFLRFFVSKTKKTINESLEFILKLQVGGIIENLEYDLDAYSEYTILGMTDELVLGGHNLIDILKLYEDYYIILYIDKQ